MNECPTCGCTIKSHHPAVQEGGEVQLCFDQWHEPTAQQILEREAREREHSSKSGE